jgi:hypothetical protein
MDENKVRRITDAKYKNAFYQSIYKSQAARPGDQSKKLDEGAYARRKEDIDTLYYATTYHLTYGKARYSEL